MTRRRVHLAIGLAGALWALAEGVAAHIGSPDVFMEAQAGPYQLWITVRPPRVIPGVAEVEVLAGAPGVREVRIVPTPLTGAAARFAPAADRAVPSRTDPRLFTGQLWMMTAGAWQVRVTAVGELGEGTVAVPVPTLPEASLEMSRGLGALLLGFMLILAAGIVGIVSAIAREASLEPGAAPLPGARRRGRIAAVVAALAVAGILAFGNWWWSAEASSYARYVYKPLQGTSRVTDDGRLVLTVRDPGWIPLRRLDDFVTDHGHLMHLFLVSPALDRLWHLHPMETATGTFELRVPDIPKGEYELFADVVHATGIAETIIDRLELSSDVRGVPLEGDDSAWTEAKGSQAIEQGGVLRARLRDGAALVWLRDTPLRTKQLTRFTFRVEDAVGQPAPDLELYMGMPGHAVFVRRDRQVFAHVHPSGSAPMAAVEISRRSLDEGGGTTSPGAAHLHDDGRVPATISFPYGFPEPGDYRIFVQIKRNGRVETGVFEARVE